MTSSFPPRTTEQAAGVPAMDTPRDAPPALVPRRNGIGPLDEAAAPGAPNDAQQLSIEVADWDVLFEAVTATLRGIVGERLESPPVVPAHTAALSASLVQAVVLDCVGALDRLHAALKQERSQRPPP